MQILGSLGIYKKAHQKGNQVGAGFEAQTNGYNPKQDVQGRENQILFVFIFNCF
jgi:hypothetical protein